MRHFAGFTAGDTATLTLPDALFTEVLPYVEDLDELKVTLLTLRRLALMRANVAPWVTHDELRSDAAVRAALGEPVEPRLEAALARAVERGTLLEVTWTRADGTAERRYLANTPRGRAAVAAMQRGADPGRAPDEAPRPNIFALYEQNVGPLTALLSEELMEAERTYPAAWIEEAFREAVRRNVRNWKYIRAILERWRTEGRDEIRERDRTADARRYIEGPYADIIQH